MTDPRLPGLAPNELDDSQRALYDTIVTGPRARGPQVFPLTDEAGVLAGPFNAMLLSPPVGAALQALGGAIRYGSALTSRDREIAILVVVHSWNCAFEVYAHEAIARAAGFSDDEINAVRAQNYEPFDGRERLVAETSLALVARSALSDREFAAARDVLGLTRLYELTTLVGYYATVALQLRVFDVGPPT